MYQLYQLLFSAVFFFLIPLTVSAAEPLLISGAEAGNITDTAALVSWQTNRPATTVATYAQSPCPCSQGVSDPPDRLITLHRIQLSGLTASRDYWIQPTSIDADGNRADGPVLQIRTLPSTALPSVEISNLEVSGVGSAVATVRWRTNTNVLDASGVEYGTSPCPCANNVQVDLGSGTEHRVEVAPLEPNTAYFVRPFSYHPKDTNTIAYGPGKTFTTLMGTAASSNTPSVLLTYPNGGQQWNQGQRHLASWKVTPGFVNAVRVSLVNEKQERTILVASQSTENRPTGSVAVLLPSPLPYGQYRVEVANAANPDEQDRSDNTLTIGEPPSPTPPPAPLPVQQPAPTFNAAPTTSSPEKSSANQTKSTPPPTSAATAPTTKPPAAVTPAPTKELPSKGGPSLGGKNVKTKKPAPKKAAPKTKPKTKPTPKKKAPVKK